MGGGASTSVNSRRDDIPSAEDLHRRYQLKNRIQVSLLRNRHWYSTQCVNNQNEYLESFVKYAFISTVIFSLLLI